MFDFLDALFKKKEDPDYFSSLPIDPLVGILNNLKLSDDVSSLLRTSRCINSNIMNILNNNNEFLKSSFNKYSFFVPRTFKQLELAIMEKEIEDNSELVKEGYIYLKTNGQYILCHEGGIYSGSLSEDLKEFSNPLDEPELRKEFLNPYFQNRILCIISKRGHGPLRFNNLQEIKKSIWNSIENYFQKKIQPPPPPTSPFILDKSAFPIVKQLFCLAIFCTSNEIKQIEAELDKNNGILNQFSESFISRPNLNPYEIENLIQWTIKIGDTYYTMLDYALRNQNQRFFDFLYNQETIHFKFQDFVNVHNIRKISWIHYSGWDWGNVNHNPNGNCSLFVQRKLFNLFNKLFFATVCNQLPEVEKYFNELKGTEAIIPLTDYFLLSVYCGHLPIVQFFIEQKAYINIDINAKNTSRGDTAIHLAADRNGTLDLVVLLIKNNADCNIKNNDGNTALHFAVYYNKSLDIVKFLIQQGADIDAKNNDGNTVLHFAAYHEAFDIVKFLIQQGADIDAKNNDENTALYLAIHKKAWNIVTSLITHQNPIVSNYDINEVQDLISRLSQLFHKIDALIKLGNEKNTEEIKKLSIKGVDLEKQFATILMKFPNDFSKEDTSQLIALYQKAQDLKQEIDQYLNPPLAIKQSAHPTTMKLK